MKVKEVRGYLGEEFSYPVDLETVLEEAGDVEVEAPDARDTRELREVLGHIDADRYNSAKELQETIQSHVDDEYIGRKHYDDRGTGSEGVADTNDVKRDGEDHSF